MSSFSKSSELTGPTGWTTLAYAYAAAAAAAFAYVLYGIPIQLTDSFGNMQQLHHGSVWDLVYNQFYQRSYLRPLLWGHLRVVFDLSGGNYYAWFRGWHVAQVALLFVLFLRLLRPRSAGDFAAVALGLAALIGIHTFAGTVREAFPINTFLTILLCCFAAADLALGEPRWWRSVLAWLLFVFAALTVESGLLVAVIFIAAYVTGGRGLSRWGLGGIVVLLAGYFWLRFVYLDVGGPGLIERGSGFGFGALEPEQLIERFGSNPLAFYAYNVLSSLATVLVAEPRAGIFVLTRGIVTGEMRPYDLVNVCASTLGTLFIAGYAWQRRRAWWSRQTNRADQLVIVFAAVLGANAVISYPYTKDVIMSPAGAFFAVAMAVAVADALGRLPVAGSIRSGAVVVLLLLTSSLWAWRAVGIHVALRHTAVVVRNEWAYADLWFARERNAPTDPFDVRMKEQLQNDSIERRRMLLVGDWLEWFEE